MMVLAGGTTVTGRDCTVADDAELEAEDER